MTKKQWLIIALCTILFSIQTFHGAAQETSSPLAYGETASGFLTTTQVTQTWTFSGSEREVVQITAQRIGGQFTPHLRLLDANGLVLAENSNVQTPYADEIIFSTGLPSAGEYRIEVASASPLTDRIDNPNEYSLTLNRIGTHRRNLLNDLPTIGTGDELPPELTSETVIIPDDNLLEVTLYNANQPIRQDDRPNLLNVYTIDAVSGNGQITVSNARPLSRMISALSIVEGGVGFINTTNSVFFTNQQTMTIAQDTEGVVTVTLGDENNTQTIVTDFYNIVSIQAIDNLVVVRMTSGQRLILSGAYINLHRRANQGVSDEPIFEIQLDNNGFVNTDLAGWHTLTYLEGQLHVLYGSNGQFISDQIRLDVLQNNENPVFSNITLYDNNSNNVMSPTSSFNIDWLGTASPEDHGVFPVGDIEVSESSLRIAPIDGREIIEAFSFNDDRRTVANILIEQGAVRIQRIDGTFRLSLPDTTEIITPTSLALDSNVLPYQANYAPKGLNNLGSDPMPTIPSQNPVADNLPVNPINGNFYYAVQDFYIPSHTLELKFERYYNSQAPSLTPTYMMQNPYRFGQMGVGWRHSYQFELDITQAPSGQVTLILPEGTRHIFNALQGTTVYRSSTLLSLTIERVNGTLGRWTANSSDGIAYLFDRAGRLESISNSDGHELIFSPAPREYLSSEQVSGLFIVEPYGRRLELYMDATEHITTVRDTLSRQTSYSYRDDSLEGVQYIDSAQTATYTYNDEGWLTEFNDVHSPYHQQGMIFYNTDQRRVVRYVENPNGDQQRRFEYTYDITQRITTRTIEVSTSANEIEQRSETWQYDENFVVINYTSPRSEFTYTYTYDRNTQLLTSVRQPDFTTFRFTYNAQGVLTQFRDPIYTDSGSYDYTYEMRGSRQLLQQVRYPNGGRETFIYENTPAAHLIERRQLVSLGPTVERTQRFTYDAWGRIASVTSAAPTPNAGEVVTVYTYDDFGYLSSVQVGDSWVMSFRHDLLGRLRSITDGNGNNYSLDWSSTQNLLTAIQGPEGYFQMYSYDALGRLVTWNDRGNTTQYSYNDLNLVVEITDPTDQISTFAYDEMGNLLRSTDANGRIRLYTYDALNNLTSIADNNENILARYDMGLESGGSYTYRRSEDLAGGVSVYRYDALGRLKRVTLINGDNQRAYELAYDAVGNMTSITEEYTGRNLYITYNYLGEIISSTIESTTTNYGYGAAGNLISVTDPSGLTTAYEHDVLGHVTGVLFSDGTRSTYRYDGNGNLVSVIDAVGQETVYVYDALNRLTSIIEPGGRTTRYVYDEHSNLVSVIDPMEYTRTATYDDLNRITSLTDAAGSTTSYQYDDLGRLASINAPLGLTTQYAYNADNNIVAITQPSGRQTIFDYDVLGRLTSITDALGHTYLYSYNQFGNLSSVTDPLGNSNEYGWRNGRPGTFLDGNNRSYQYNPDMVGRVITIRDFADGGVNLLFDYDRAGRITSIQAGTDRLFSNSDETEWGYQYDEAHGWIEQYTDPAGNVWAFSRDDIGRITEVQNPAGVFTRYEYDAAGQISRVIYAAGTELETSEQFVYDLNGNVTQYTAADGVVTTYRYDANNRLVEIREAVGTPLERSYGFQYDAVGNLIRTIDPNGAETDYRYDSFGNRTLVIQARGDQRIEYSYTYDLVGNLTGVTLPEGQTINIAYDALNRRVRYVDSANGVWAYTYDSAGNLTQVSDPLGNVTRYEYNTLNRLGNIVYPDGAVVSLTYNQRGNFQNVVMPPTGNTDEQERTEYTIDEAGNLVNIRDNADADEPADTRFQYNAFGQITNRLTPTDETTQYSYDALGRLVEIINPDGTTQTRAYDAAGRLTLISDGENDTITFAYDALGRLTQVQADDITVTYSYDAVNNLTQRDAGTFGAIVYTYDAANRPVRIQYGDDAIDLIYDRNGWRTQLIRSNDITTNYTYDANGHPQFITHIDQNGELIDGFSYLYNSVGTLTRVDRIDSWAILYNYNATQQIIDERWLSEVNDARYALSLNYDGAGNVIDATRDGSRTLYVYNAQNQLIGEFHDYNPTETSEISWLPIIGLLAGGGYIGRKHWRRWIWISPVIIALLIFPALQLQAQTPEAPTPDVTYTYFENGNLNQITYHEDNNQNYTLLFEYDSEYRLIGVEGRREGGERVEIRLNYDELGRLSEWQNISERYRLIYDGQTLIAVQNLSSQETTRYFVPFPNEILLSILGSDSPIWSLQDATNSPRRFTDDAGNILRDESGNEILRYEFNVFGELIDPYGNGNTEPTAPTPLFSGRLYDPVLELYLNDDRAYDPITNRFLQRSQQRHDPSGNLYSEFNPRDYGNINQTEIPYRYLYDGTFAPSILDSASPRTLLGSPVLPSEMTSPTTAQLQAEENVRVLRLAARLNGQQAVTANFLEGYSDSPLRIDTLPSMIDHYTNNLGWLPDTTPHPLALSEPLSIIADAQTLITDAQPFSHVNFGVPALPNPIAMTLQTEAGLPEMLQEVQMITGLLPEVQALFSLQPSILPPDNPEVDITIPQARIIPPALNELYNLYRSPLWQENIPFPEVSAGNPQLTP
jgi:YD repeat-containing protein